MALDYAYETSENLKDIYLITDGIPVYGESSPEGITKYINKKQKQTQLYPKINTISFNIEYKATSFTAKRTKKFLEAASTTSQGSLK